MVMPLAAKRFSIGLAAIVLMAATGCLTGSRQSPVDPAAPGWEVRQAQALWRPDAQKPEIAGDLIVSTHPSGSAFVQFSKTLPIASARMTRNSWEIDFPPQQRHYAGRGAGPARVVWLQLLRALQDRPLTGRWILSEKSDSLMTVTEPKTGETLEVYF